MHARIFAFIVAATLASSLPVAAQVSDRQFEVNGATDLRLNVSGNVHLMPSSSAQSVTFHVIDYGPPIPTMKFTNSRAGKRLTISVSGPSQSILPFNGPTGYELQVTYPATLKIDLREFAGHIQADRLTAAAQLYDADGSIDIAGADGPVTAEADNGGIVLGASRGSIQLTTGNGPVAATLDRGWRGNLVRLESSNGALRLLVPPDFRGRYDLTSAEGAVHNAFHTVNGAPLVFMLTQNGDVSVSSDNQ